MSVATLEGDKKETCPVCFEELALNKTSRHANYPPENGTGTDVFQFSM